MYDFEITLCVVGGRRYRNSAHVFAELDDAHRRLGLRLGRVIAGDGNVANFAIEWARMNGVPYKQYHADWDRIGKSAGYKRSAEMVRDATHLMAFPGGPGTEFEVKEAKRLGIPRILV